VSCSACLAVDGFRALYRRSMKSARDDNCLRDSFVAVQLEGQTSIEDIIGRIDDGSTPQLPFDWASVMGHAAAS
jgi:hypothetical protein